MGTPTDLSRMARPLEGGTTPENYYHRCGAARYVATGLIPLGVEVTM